MRAKARLPANPDATLETFVDAGKAAEIDAGISADIERERCQKFILLTSMAGSTAALRSPIGPIAADQELRAFFRLLMADIEHPLLSDLNL